VEPAVGDPLTMVVEFPVDVGEGVRTLATVIRKGAAAPAVAS